MSNRFKVEQISTDQYVLRRRNISKLEYITNTLDVIVLDSIGSHNEVVFDSLSMANDVLNAYNKESKRLREKESFSKSGLAFKSVKFKSVLHRNGLEEVIGVQKDE